jgi:YVTN family beta-propeller protein
VTEFRVLGALEAVDQGSPLTLGGPQQKALLAVLLVHRGEPVSSDRLIDALWGERAPPTASKIVQGYVLRLRRALGDGVLVTRGHGYVLQVEAGQTDVGRFEAFVAEGRRALQDGDAEYAAARLREGLELWRGPPLADFAYEPFAQAEIARLEEARLAALGDRIDAEFALGEHAGLVGELEALARAHPLNERFTARLMLALYRSGRQADALASYRVARQRLVEELGLEPSRDLQEIERAILTQDPALDPPARDATRELPAVTLRRRRGRLLIAAGTVVLLAVLVAVAFGLGGSGEPVVRVSANSLAAIDTRTDRIVGAVGVGTRPSGVAFGSGSLWVANLDDQSVSRVDPKTLERVRTVSVDGPPTGIAAAGRAVWVVGSNPGANSVSVTRIDPQFDVIDRTARLASVVPGSPGAVAAQGGALWVAPFSGLLARLDSRTGRVVKQLDPNTAPAGIALGAGAVWMTDRDANNVTQVDATGLGRSLAVGHGPSGIAVGYGGVWVADTGDNAIVRVDPSTRAVTETIPVGHAPAGVSIGAGSVWVANSGDGTVTRIDPKTEKPIATIAVGGSPQAITVVGNRAWVTVAARVIPAVGPAVGGTARLDSRDDVDFTDPALAYFPLSWQLLYATCAKLLNYPDATGLAGSQLVPEVAQAQPARSADGKTYTFTIRGGFRFSPPSNEPVNAQTFKDTIERTLNPRMKSPAAGEFRDIVGARAYMARRAPHIAGVVARANTLTIRLTGPAPDLVARLTQPWFCAVPSNTPIDPKGVRLISSAGPYSVTSYTPGQGVVLTRNPNYHGSRPHRLARIEMAVGIPGGRAVAQVEAGTADYAVDGEIDLAKAGTRPRLAARYGPGSPAARRGRQQYFVTTAPALDLLALNTHRPLFANVRLRRAVSYAIDRAALARLGGGYGSENPTDHYLPPGVPGYRNVHAYAFTPDVARARRLAAGRAHSTAVLYTCDQSPCEQQAQIIKTDLAAIGLRVEVKAFSIEAMFAKIATPGEPFDIAPVFWAADYPDPTAFLNLLLESGTSLPTFDDPTYRARLAAAAQLTGADRYLTYARLDADLARNAGPLVAYGNASRHELFSARMGCQLSGFYGTDLAALCIKRAHRHS